MSSPYREKAAPKPLDRWIECCWSMCSEEPIPGHAVRPDGCLDLLFSSTDGLRVVGAMTSEMRFDLPAGGRSVGIRFRPGMARGFFAIPAGKLMDSRRPLKNSWAFGRKKRKPGCGQRRRRKSAWGS